MSQNEKFNLPYDRISISTGTKVEKNSFVYTVMARDSFYGKPICLGKYASSESARKAFDMIIVAGNSDMKSYHLPKDGEL